ncbi:MAG: ABC transporter substrate-binding protein [Dehalococcoidia bacterium]
MHYRALVSTLALGALLVPLLAACAPTPTTPSTGGQTPPEQGSQPVRGGAITEIKFADASTIQPLLIQDTASRAYEIKHYNAPLLRYDPETVVLGTKDAVAESFDLSPDGLKVTFKLRSNVKWSDGRPITSADYKFTFDKMKDPKVEYPYRSLYAKVDRAETPDDRTIVFTLTEAFCPILGSIADINPLPKHIFENLDINDNPLNQKPVVGSGPYLLKEWVKDSHATFTANENFYLGRPNLDTWTIKIVKDQNVAFSQYKTGEADYVTLRAQDYEDAKANPNGQVIQFYAAASSWTYIGFNERNEILKDLKVRQALSYATNRQQLIDRVRLGRSRPTQGIVTPSSWAYVDDVTKFPYDMAKANQLLDEAGWRRPANNPQGTRVKDGKELKMRIFYNTGNNEREQIATVTQAQARQLGWELEVVGEEFQAYVNRVNNTRDMELFILGWSSGLDPNGTENIWVTGKPQNSTGFTNAQVDTLYPKAASITGCKESDRKPIYGEISKLVTADAPYIFLYENEILYGLSNRIQSVPFGKLVDTSKDTRVWQWYSKTGK